MRRTHRLVAALLLLLFIVDILAPTTAWALTGGPSQPEFESFEPVNTDQMVDLFTGDFTYNIPLLTVPGPNGGYPINLAYHAGIGVEQEASWVGLGWNVNAGVINRSLRGLPDDFNGEDKVKTVTRMRPNQSVAISLGNSNVENLGFCIDPGIGQVSGRATMYRNNYRGIGIRTDIGISSTLCGQAMDYRMNNSGLIGRLSVGLDSRNGLEMSPSIAYSDVKGAITGKTSIGASLNSNYGLVNLEVRTTSLINKVKRDDNENVIEREGLFSLGSGFSFASPSYVPASESRNEGRSFTVGLAVGNIAGPTWDESFNATGSFSSVYIPPGERYREIAAFGYLYAHRQAALGSGLTDLQRDKDVAVNRRIPYVPMPIHTYDPLMIKGQGTGGMVRPQRSDIGILTEEAVHGASHGMEATFEVGTGVGAWKIGADLGYEYTSSYAGPWRSDAAALTGGITPLLPAAIHPGNPNIRFQPSTPDKPLYEPFYFKVAGERTANKPETWDAWKGEDPVRFDLKEVVSASQGLFPSVSMKPVVRNHVPGLGSNGIPLENNRRAEREKRVQLVEHRTLGDLQDHPDYGIRPHILYPANVLPTTAGVGQQLQQGEAKPHHTAEMTVVAPDGTRHIYGLPAYNMVQREVVFSIQDPIELNGSVITNAEDVRFAQMPTDYQGLEEQVSGSQTRERYYSSTQLPGYAHSYLLTAVVSHDYVDLTGDGPSPDDLGYYAKFNYTKEQNEKWRSPFTGVHYIKGHHSDDLDDKGSYTYGEKEIYYLHSIETRTHIALFRTSARNDGRGVLSEQGGTQGPSLLKLDRIDLYSRTNTNVVLKSVVFTYDYDLCGNTPNSTASGGGKLTLRKVHFEHMGSAKGRLSPYVFSYAPAGTEANPNYSPFSVDRWGNYRPSGTWLQHFPYVDQTENYDAARHDHASAWCLRSIKLPSGGTINVEYESDDYAFVQGRPAMQMFKIIGTSEISATVPENLINPGLRKGQRRIYVDMGRAYATQAELRDAIRSATEGVGDLYFSTWQYMRQKAGLEENAYDRVEGWARIADNSSDASTQILGGQANRVAYFDVRMANYGIGPKDVHPFRKAGWQKLRYERPDLATPDNDLDGTLMSVAGLASTLSILASSARMLLGYYNTAAILGWNSHIQALETQPSFVRLRTPVGMPHASGTTKGKYGGGLRVKRIQVQDVWEEGSAAYGKEYRYTTTMPDGRVVSSGVAEYEPLLGGEEIPHRKPVWYNGSDSRVSFRNEDAYLEEPFGEALFPGANVGYSRVEVSDILPEGVTRAGNGTVVHEFYTAKDFPVRVVVTDLDDVHFAPPTIPIPFIGSIGYNNHGYSQGYAVHLNDMHGKQKSISTFPQCTAPEGEPKTRISYMYNTEPGHPDRLSDLAQVITDRATVETARLGTTVEFYTDMREHSSEHIGAGFQFNIQGSPIPPVPMAMPAYQFEQSIFRSVVTTKVVHKLGILGEVVNEVDGARATTRTLLYDASTGEPLLTVVNNAWKKPVYTYQYAAHLAYSGMGSAAINWGAGAQLQTTGVPGEYTMASPLLVAEVFHLGDELVGNGVRAWIMAVDENANTITLRDAANAPVNGLGSVRIARSGRRNLQSVKNGTIVSLRHIAATPLPVLLEQFNGQVLGATLPAPSTCDAPANSQCALFNYTPCEPAHAAPREVGAVLGAPLQAVEDFSNGSVTIEFNNAGECKPVLILPNISTGPGGVGSIGTVYNLNDIQVIGMAGEPFAVQGLTGTVEPISILVNGGTQPVTAYWHDPNGCIGRCEKVLHADATEYRDTWTYDHADAGVPTSVIPSGGANTVNPYRYGISGIWRPWNSHLYQVDRQNTESEFTHVDKDGEYKTFTRFDFATPANNPGERWVRREEMTRYSPYGFALESKDANNILSSMLYGYDHSKAVAQAANAGYYEVAFDGFEDHGSTYQSGHGHLFLTSPVGNLSISSQAAHTGRGSVATLAGQHLVMNATVQTTPQAGWVPKANKRYTVSAWVRANNSTFTPTIDVLDGNGQPLPIIVEDLGQAAVEGWKKVTVTFTTPAAGSSIQLRFGATGASSGLIHVDDIRIHPSDASITTYVYHPGLHWLLAELDDRNYATFYNYDEEGTLVQVKKETERGVMTLRTTRKNVVQLP
jgi:hypothetical protein